MTDLWIQAVTPLGVRELTRRGEYLELTPDEMGSFENPLEPPWFSNVQLNIAARSSGNKPGTYSPGLNSQTIPALENRVATSHTGTNGESPGFTATHYERWPVGQSRPLVLKVTIKEGSHTTNPDLHEFVRIWFVWQGTPHFSRGRMVQFADISVSIPIPALNRALDEGVITTRRVWLFKRYFSEFYWSDFRDWQGNPEQPEEPTEEPEEEPHAPDPPPRPDPDPDPNTPEPFLQKLLAELEALAEKVRRELQ